MSRHRSRSGSKPPFAAVVDDLRQQPPVSADDRARLRAPDRRVFVETDGDLTPEAALALVAAGASVAWDSCGCQGYCGIDWFDAADAARLARSEPPEFVPVSRKVPHAAGRLSSL